MPDHNHLLGKVAKYYSGKLAAHGETPQGVDWNGVESQQQRFCQLSRIMNPNEPFSLIDLGCGYGALIDYLDTLGMNYSYHGYDVSPEMIQSARRLHPKRDNLSFSISATPESVADYTVASGIFNVMPDNSPSQWLEYIESTLAVMDRSSQKGFAFNCLTSYSDKEKMRDHLYYADPCYFFDLCKRRYSRQVSLLHDYGLYEFTLLVRKD
jgi:SAM-dependent methyltransferase